MYDNINPQHYKRYPVEVIDMMVQIFGLEQTMIHCILTAFKYRMRMGTKPTSTIEEDLEKEKWYLEKAEQLKKQLKSNITPTDHE